MSNGWGSIKRRQAGWKRLQFPRRMLYAVLPFSSENSVGEAMKAFGCVLILLVAGCWSEGERAPWNRPNTLLGNGRGHWLDDAVKDARGDNMRMQGDVAKSGNTPARNPRSSSASSDE
jgi:hypothetical protein